MKLKYWLIITGPTIAVLITIFALSPEDYFDSEDSIWISSQPSTPAGMGDILSQTEAAQHSPGSDGSLSHSAQQAGSPLNKQNGGTKMLTVAQQTQQPPQQIKPQPGVMNFEQAPRVKFKGTIQQISEFQKRDGQIHIWIHDKKVEKEISIAPSWFLEHLGCNITHDVRVTGTGFLFNDKALDPLIYAKKIIVNRKTCRLRNDEGFALWSSRLR